MRLSLYSPEGDLKVTCAVMDNGGLIPWLNQIENTDTFSSLKIEALQVGVAPFNSYDDGKQQQKIQYYWFW